MRTTTKQLKEKAELINKIMIERGLPAGYTIQWAYNAPRLERYTEPERELTEDVSPRLSPKELMTWMEAFIRGIRATIK